MSEYEDRTEQILKKYDMKIMITFKEVTVPPFNGSNGRQSNKYIVYITRYGKKIQFPFYDSIHNYQNNLRPKKYDVLNTFCSEALSGFSVSSPKDVMNEFGYTRYVEANRVYRGLRKISEKAEKLNLSEEDLSNILDFIDNGE